MNIFVFILLVAYLLIQGFEYWLKAINLSHMKKFGTKVPEGFETYIDEALLSKTHAYTIEHNKLSYIESIFGSAVLLVFMFGGVLNAYNSWIASYNIPFILQGTVFSLALSYASSLLSIPFSLYSTFRIENKYGFNTMTAKLWLSDFMKSLVLSTVILGVILITGLWIVQSFPEYWWLLVWGFFFVFSIFMMYIAPYVIEPLFNKFTPLEGDQLEAKIRSVMQKAGIEVSRVFKIDASKRSHHTNAYFTGIGKVKRIVLYDTLISKMEQDEIIAVLAHEVGHWKKRHVFKRIVVFELLSLAAAYIGFRLLQNDFLAVTFRMDEATFFSKLVILGFFFSIVSFPFTPLSSYFSRRHEEEADRFAVELTTNPESLATSLIKLSKDNLSNLHPHPFYARFYYSHPPVVERIRKIRTGI